MAFLQTDSNGSSNSSINLDGILQNSSSEASFLSSKMERKKTVDEVWRDIMEGKIEEGNRKMIPEFKAESIDEIMTLEDFLLKAGAVDETEIGIEGDVDVDVKTENGIGRLSGGVYPMYLGGSGSGISVDGSMDGFELIGGSGNMARGKRRVSMLDGSMDKAAQQRQRRMIKNRESAARSRERKQAYQAELESMAVRLEEENEMLLKEKAEKTKERFKQLMQHVIPVVEKRRPARALRSVRSMEL